MKKNIYVLIILSFFSFNLSSIAQNNALTLSLDELTINSNMGLGTTNVTGECWVNIPSVSEKGAFINVGDGSSGYGIGVGNGNWDSDGNELIIIYNGPRWIRTNKNIGTGWHHIAFTIDAVGTARAFLDEKLVKESPGTGPLSPSGTTFIGSGGGGRYLTNGIIDEVRLWNIDRAEAEIRADMYKELVPGDEANLVAYYRFNETSGQILNDETSNNNNGTLSAGINFTDNGTPSIAFFGPKNALNFVSDDYAIIPSVFGIGTSSVTLECWVNLSSTSQKGAFVHIGNHDVGYGMGVGSSDWDNNGNQFHILYDQRRWIPTGTNIGTGWHHVVLILDANSDPTVYLDGEEIYSDSGQTDPIAPSGGSSIGSSEQGTRGLSDGTIDEVRIWDDVRTQTEIRENMLRTLTGNEANLVAYYNLDGNVVVDLSGNGYDGSIGGDGNESVTSTAFNSWLNTNSTSWATESNWSLGSVPTTTDNVAISNQNTNPEVSSTANCNDLLIETGASLSLNDGASFINYGNLYINGDFIYNKTLTSDNKWHIISAPNATATANLFFGDYLQNWNESTGLWEQIDDENTSLTPVKAYGFYGTHAKASYSFTGDPNDGDQSISLTTSGSGGSFNKANAVGNPYPSSIDWNLVSGYGAKYTWNGIAYEAYSETDGYGIGPRYAAPCQGFFVLPDNSGTFTLTNTMRTHNGADGFEKSEQSLSNGLLVYSQSNGYNDKLLIAFKDDSSDDFELDKDAYKVLSNTENLSQIYSLSNIDKLSIDIRPETEIIQLGFQNTANGKYSIGVLESDGIANAELEDTKLNIFYDLSIGVYEFDWLTNDSKERFVLHLKATGTDEINKITQIFAFQKTINIRSSEKLNRAQISIIDMMGRTVYEQPLFDGQNELINLPLEDGVYLVQLVSDRGTQEEKVILQ